MLEARYPDSSVLWAGLTCSDCTAHGKMTPMTMATKAQSPPATIGSIQLRE